MRIQSVTKNIKRELQCHELLEKLLARQKLTFIIDVDETVVQTSYANLQESQKQEELESNLPAYLTYQFQHSYPTSLSTCQSIGKLHDLGQGVGFISRASFSTLMRLKMLGLDFNKIDFIGFGTCPDWLEASDIEYAKQCLGIEDKNIDSLEKLLKALEEKHNIQIATEQLPQEKWRTLHRLRGQANEGVRELINRPIVAIGDKQGDSEFEYTQGGLGIKLERNMKVSTNFTNSLGRAFCYGATVLSNNSAGREIVEQVQSNGYFREEEIHGSPIKRHSIQTLSDTEAKSTWKEIKSRGPLLQSETSL